MKERLFGREKSAVSASERQLLDKLDHSNIETAMPPGVLPNTTKKKVRPSSASANLQSHPNYATGLFDNSRPSTAAPSLHGRPKTQAGGPRHWARTPQPKPQETAKVSNQRRLTIGAVDGIAETDAAYRTIAAQPQLGALFRGKVPLLK